MSYRAFKRLLGETSLERKCRFLFGAFIFLLIFGSFWIYARETEHLAYDQITTACRLLVSQIVDRRIATVCHAPPKAPGSPNAEVKKDLPKEVEKEEMENAAARDQFRFKWEGEWPTALKNYRYHVIRPDAARTEDNENLEHLKEFQHNPGQHESK